MARITVEDCVNKVSSKFELVVLASLRAKDINSGSQITVNRDSDKDSVIALREIAVGNVSVDSLRKKLIEGLNADPIDSVEEENLHVEAENLSEDLGGYVSQDDIGSDEDFSIGFEDAEIGDESEDF